MESLVEVMPKQKEEVKKEGKKKRKRVAIIEVKPEVSGKENLNE